MLGMVLCWIYRFNMSVRAPMATGPNYLRCVYEMPSGPTEEVGFVICPESRRTYIAIGSVLCSLFSVCSLSVCSLYALEWLCTPKLLMDSHEILYTGLFGW